MKTYRELNESLKRAQDTLKVAQGAMSQKEWDAKWKPQRKTITQKASNPGGIYNNIKK